MTDEPEAAPPEFVLVLEIAGELDEFVSAVSRVPGLEYLAEELGDKLEDTSLFAVQDREGGRRRARRELFVVATDERAAAELERLWTLWQAGTPLAIGWRRWQAVFERLISVRQWNDHDRLTRTGVLDAWRDELREEGDEPIPFEVELWFRAAEDRRAVEEERLAADLRAAGGRLLRHFMLEEISYHGVLAELPARVLRRTAETVEAAWLSGQGVRFLRAAGQAAVPVVEELELEDFEAPDAPTEIDRPPRVALLDGVPIAGHRLLAGRIVLDDPEGWEETAEVRHRQHGTAMASAILHGDLAAGEPPLDELLYMRPITRVDPRHDWVQGPQETIPVERLPVELIHEAVVRMLGGDEPQAPNVRIVNISVADRAQFFDRFMSPWARLLDHLAATYEVLFIVSAGNHYLELQIEADVDLEDPEELEFEVLGQLSRTASLRRLLAPAESVNAFTVGAAQLDAGEAPDDGRKDPLRTRGLAAPLSSWGAGHRRGIKPDALAPGGREVFDVQPGQGGDAARRMTPSRVARPPGIRVATPGRGGELSQTTWICGTSPATALATRASVRALQRLDELRAEWGDDMPGPEYDAVLAKALLVHGTSWAGADVALRVAMRDAHLPGTKEDVQRSLGYGLIRPAWSLVDDDFRVSALYASRLDDGEHHYRLPLPPSLAGNTAWRRVTVTLAWITPVNVAHRGYRRAAMRVDATGSMALATDRQEASNQAVVRGTVQHEILEGERAVPYVDGDDLAFTVTCRPGAGALDDEVPYAFIVTLETAQEVGIPVYLEVSSRIRQRAARIRAAAGA